MTAVACGVDVTSIARIEQTWQNAGPDFVATVWSDSELNDAAGDPAMLAKRWAAKEATMKALGVGVDTLRPIDIVIRTTAVGAPILTLSNAAERIASERGVTAWSVSMSHEGDLAIAFVTALTQ
ncbi:MAG: holo-ACP synthase [Actinomycetia bacterium]|nr:holo-ACP synthase [Actinomycetes bacterium]